MLYRQVARKNASGVDVHLRSTKVDAPCVEPHAENLIEGDVFCGTRWRSDLLMSGRLLLKICMHISRP